ncbi:MAG: serine hydrolase domain-containing protein [Jatrophihabitans sp.]|uniref:serine hydrolase domain-containing protein n=1 Tax=Jatrophihabitans sp. TaxID=1932789 RepID=UPI00391359D4
MRAHIGGGVDEGFGRVADEFRRNFASRGDVGAALAVHRDGRPVVDLWGGVRDSARRLPWERDTMVPVFSTTKGISALVVASLRSKGLLDWDETVAHYWPEFAAEGKDAITVRQLMAHEAGLAVIDQPLRSKDLMDLDALAKVLAAQRPAWAAGESNGYHAISLGLYQNELVRRIDPQHRTIGRILAEEFVEPFGLSLYIGLPDDVDLDSVAVLGRLTPRAALRQLTGVPWPLARQLADKRSPTSRSLTNPALARAERFTQRHVLAPELPSSNGVGTPRSIAALYGAAAIGAPKLPIDDVTLAELAAPVTTRVRTDLLLRARRAYALGFSRPVPEHWFGSPGGRSFGTPGLGGSFGFADPDAKVGYAYAPNRLGIRLSNDPREVAVRTAVYGCLG